MSLETIVGKKASCGGADANTGKLGCQIEWGTPLHVIGMTKGFVIPKATVFDKTYIDSQIQLGNFIPLIGAESFEDSSGEDQFSTNSRGVERLNTKGLPKYMFTYEEGHYFYREMAKLTSYKALDFIFADEEGNWRLAVDSGGDFGGFTAGQAVAMLTKTKVLGGDPEAKVFSVQLLDRNQWDMSYDFALRSQLDFAPEEIDGINAIDVTFDAVPAAAATTFDITVVLSADGLTPVEGLVIADFLYTVDGTPATISNVTENSPGKYTLTVPALSAAEVLVLKTWDSSVLKEAIISGGVLYRTEAPATTTVV